MRQPLALAPGLNLLFATVYKSVAGTFRTWRLRLAMSAHRGKADLAESMIGAELLWRRRALHRTSRPGDRRTAHSATAGTAPVPSHIAYFGGAVVLGQSGGPLSRGTHGRV